MWSEAHKRLPRWLSGKESISQCRRCRFNPWVRKIPWRRELATCSSIFAWKISWTEEPGSLRSKGCKESDTTKQLSTHTHTHTHTNSVFQATLQNMTTPNNKNQLCFHSLLVKKLGPRQAKSLTWACTASELQVTLRGVRNKPSALLWSGGKCWWPGT